MQYREATLLCTTLARNDARNLYPRVFWGFAGEIIIAPGMGISGIDFKEEHARRGKHGRISSSKRNILLIFVVQVIFILLSRM